MPQYYSNVQSEEPELCPTVADSTAHYALGGLNTVTIAPIVAAGDTLLFITGADGASEGTGTTWSAPSGATQLTLFPFSGGNGWAPFINVWTKTAVNGDAGATYTFGKVSSEAQTSFALIIKNSTSIVFGSAGANGTALSGNVPEISIGAKSYTTCGLNIIVGFAQNNQQLLPVPNQPLYTEIEQTYPTYRGGSLGLRVFTGAGTTSNRIWNIGTVGNNAFSVAEILVT